jgi:uncharacterized protein (UPF0264 family)
LAGSLGPRDFGMLRDVPVHWLGVRGSACTSNSRTERVSVDRVAQLAEQIRVVWNEEAPTCVTQ